MAYVPGQNLLSMALTLLTKQYLSYYKAGPRVLNSVGQYVTTFEPGIQMDGSWQPVPRMLMIHYGLDLQKDYYTFYTSNNVLDLDRDITGDQVAFNGERFQVESNNDWYDIDGWKGILCVHIGVDTQQMEVFGFASLDAPNSYSNFYNGNFMGMDTN